MLARVLAMAVGKFPRAVLERMFEFESFKKYLLKTAEDRQLEGGPRAPHPFGRGPRDGP